VSADLTGIAVGTYPAGFTQLGTTCTATLAASATCTITVQFAPTTDALYSGPVGITADVPVANSPVSVSGTGYSAPIASITPALAFGDLATGTTATQDLILSNIGNADLTNITVGAFPAGFSRQGGDCIGTLAANTTCTITVQFAPIAALEYAGDVSITAFNVAVANSPVSLSGSGVAPQGTVAFTSASSGILNAGGTELDFGDLPNNPDVSSTVVLTASVNPVTFQTLTVTGNARFSKGADTCSGQTIAVDATCTVEVIFDPQGNGAKSATLTAPHDGTGGAQVLSLLGQ
jgi:hypothetical protein